MPDGHLNLLFPQWQGSGPDNALYYAALALAGACGDIRFSRVRVSEREALDSRNGILGYDSILAQMTEAAALVGHAAPASLLTIGGDCGIAPVPVSYLNRKYKDNLTVVWLDAHGDLNTPETSPSGHFHGMPLAALLGLGDPAVCRTCFSVIRPDQIILAGTRNLDPAESRLIDEMGITRVSAGELEAGDSAPGSSALIRAIQGRGCPNVYLHIDMDVLDPTAYPHIRHPEPGGIQPGTLVNLIGRIRDICNVVGAGIVEFTLPADTRNGGPEAIPAGSRPGLGLPVFLVNQLTF